MRLLSYNMAKRPAAWADVHALDADVGLLQECAEPVGPRLRGDDGGMGLPEFQGTPWKDAVTDPSVVWRSAVARLSTRVAVEWIRPHLAWVTPPDQERVLVMSLYAPWRRSDPATGSSWIYADASAHQRINDLSAFIGNRSKHRIIAAGDLNILYGYGENGDTYWRDRYQTVFDRMHVMGLHFCGPQYPNGRQAEPWPAELPKDSLNVPTYHTNRTTPRGAKRQLDFVFASESIADTLTVRALNGVDEWGKSDHCRVVIETR